MRLRRWARRGSTTERRVLLRARLRLVAWSAGSMLVVLLVLGTLLHGLVEQQLQADSEAQLRARADIMVRLGSTRTIALPSPQELLLGMQIVQDAATPGFQIGGPTTGTIAFLVGEDGLPLGDDGPDPMAVEDALTTGTMTMRETELARFEGVPVRVYTTPFARDDRRYAVQVVADRRTELRTLDLLRSVLGIGGLVAIGAAMLAGWVFAGRALVPVRAAMARQREFTADASHELRTPLAVIRTNAELLGRPELEPAMAAEVVADISLEAARMGSLVDQLLVLARADADALDAEAVPTDLARAAASAVASLEARAASRSVTLELDAERVLVLADPGRLTQLTALLVDNAITHAPEGGEVRVAVARQGHTAVLRVEDDGPGVRPEDRGRVFDRFWRAPDAPPGGSGLGLAIASEMVSAHGGTIAVGGSRLGGALFAVTLPSVGGPRHPADRPEDSG